MRAAPAPLLLLAVAACTAVNPIDDRGPPDAAPPTPCSDPGAARCVGQDYQTCAAGLWETFETCAPATPCTESGCGVCDRAWPTVCVGTDLYACEPEGTLGDLISACGTTGCVGHSCVPVTHCQPGSQLIYLLDSDSNLLSFDPLQGQDAYQLVGRVDCPAGAPWPAVSAEGEYSARPLSMSVDRAGRAWVLYSSGELFWVSTVDASCEPSPFTRGDGGFQLFGMGFVADSPGSDRETLYIVGGPDETYAGDTSMSQLGAIDPEAVSASALGPIEVKTYEPELTGTGDAELWAYFPAGKESGEVARLDRATGERLASYSLPPASGRQTAWAFAHHGGRYYVFRTAADAALGEEVSQVLRLDPAASGGAGAIEVVTERSLYKIVGAGVSTCVPVVINSHRPDRR